MVSRRIERLTSRLQEEVSRIIMYEISDPRMGFVTVTEVKLAQDLKSADVSVSVMGDMPAQEATLHTLQHARGHIQRLLAGRLVMRRIPKLRFHLDQGVKRSVRISSLLRELAVERQAREGDAPAGEDTEDSGETEAHDLPPSADED